MAPAGLLKDPEHLLGLCIRFDEVLMGARQPLSVRIPLVGRRSGIDARVRSEVLVESLQNVKPIDVDRRFLVLDSEELEKVLGRHEFLQVAPPSRIDGRLVSE
jgi:hypothetical protein